MSISMRNIVSRIALVGVLVLSFKMGMAQDNTYQSVLNSHSWYRLSVTKEGVYKLDYSTLQAMGINMGALNPNQIRLFAPKNLSVLLPALAPMRRFP